MKPRILFLAVLCVLLYGWYQIGILPYVSNGSYPPQGNKAAFRAKISGRDSLMHASAQPIPGVW